MAKERTTVQSECGRSIRAWGGYAHKVTDATICPRCRKQIVPPAGRPEYFCTIGTLGFVVEVKAGTKGWRFSSLREQQRNWAEWYINDTGGLYCIWLSMGRRRNAKVMPRKTWLVPYHGILAAEDLVGQDTLPYLAGKGYSTRLQEDKLDAVHILANFEMKYADGVWQRPTQFPVSGAGGSDG